MIFHSDILALLIASLFTTAMVLYASAYGWQIVRKWDMTSGSELQLELERKTYLVSTLLALAFGWELLSLFLYISAADRLHSLFSGAMCAAGALNVNGFGYPALLLKLVNFLLAGGWLILNHADTRAYDYPLIRWKYALILLAAPLFLAEAATQAAYFLQLRPEIITSCCGTLFSSERSSLIPQSGVGADFLFVFYSGTAVVLASGTYFLFRGKAAGLFSLAGMTAAVLSAAALVTFISSYIYEMPAHHCPFCILQGEYHHIGYFFYATLLGGALSGAGISLLSPFRNRPTLSGIVPVLQRKMAIAGLVCHGSFAVAATWAIASSNLVL